jgi:hypothetical protein
MRLARKRTEVSIRATALTLFLLFLLSLSEYSLFFPARPLHSISSSASTPATNRARKGKPVASFDLPRHNSQGISHQ